jgi:hypothetical protein
MGAQVVLTEQAELVALLRQNLKANFEDDSAIAAAVLFLLLCVCFVVSLFLMLFVLRIL